VRRLTLLTILGVIAVATTSGAARPAPVTELSPAIPEATGQFSVVATDPSPIPRLTRDVPRFVANMCATARRSHPPIPVVCPPLVPTTKYRPVAGSSGFLLGNTGVPRLKPPLDRIYLLGFNGGDSGPVYWHWIAGMGSPRAIQHWVLSDADNEVKGKPTRLMPKMIAGRRVEIFRFPDHPAGGQFGGHYAAITSSGPYLVVASIHGENANKSASMAVALARKAEAGR
jgi:hypothetical protein